jgi:hypothetical protein
MNLATLLTLLLLGQAPTQPIQTRVVEAPESPVTLVGMPCGEVKKQVRVEAASESNLLESKPFTCGRDCAVGIKVKSGQRLSSVVIATGLAHDKGRITSAVSPALDVAKLQSCNGDAYFVTAGSKIEWPVTAGIVWVHEAVFLDGTKWTGPDAEQLLNQAFRDYILQPRKSQ